MISIHKRLLISLLAGLLLVSVLAGIATYLRMLQEINEMQDFELQQIAYTVESATRALPADEMVLHSQVPTNPEFNVQIWRRDGRLQYASHPATPLPMADSQGFSHVRQAGGEAWRTYTLAVDDRVVQSAQTVRDLSETAVETVLAIFMPFLVLVPVLLLVVWYAVRRGLRPLERVAVDIECRDSASMAPLDEAAVPAEVQPLVRALNELLARLDRTMSLQRQFVSDAAHELRTPLTALSLQAQLVKHAADAAGRNQALEELGEGIGRATHLVEQLLSLARQEPGATPPFTPVDLSELAASCAGDLAPLAAAKTIDLGVEAEGPVMVRGDRASLTLLLGNLIDNAIRYIQPGGRIDVTLCERSGQAILSVADNGPGIPAAERELVFDRFYRPPGQSVSGSGLGLAIVREVAVMHGAEVSLADAVDAGGALFTVTFPASGS